MCESLTTAMLCQADVPHRGFAGLHDETIPGICGSCEDRAHGGCADSQRIVADEGVDMVRVGYFLDAG